MLCEAAVWHMHKVGHIAESILADVLRTVKDFFIVYVKVEAIFKAYEELSLVEIGASKLWPSFHLVSGVSLHHMRHPVGEFAFY